MVFVVLLAYNEQEAIGALIKSIHQVMQNSSLNHQFVVVNDGSTDRTEEIIIELQSQFPIILKTHKLNKGPGAAFRTGLITAGSMSKPGDVIVTMEADFTSDPQILPRMVNQLKNGYHLVAASRYLPGGSYIGFPLNRLLFSKSANYLCRILFPIKNLHDYTLFYRAYNAEIINRALVEYGDNFITFHGFSSNLEILLKLRRGMLKCSEIPMVYRYDLKHGKSKMKVMKNLLDYFILIKRELCTTHNAQRITHNA